jgi:glutathione S-transferase
MSFQHGSGYFNDRMNCIKEWAQDCHAKVVEFFDFLENHLSANDYICCQRFTAADINAYTTVQFAKVIGVRISSEQPHLQDWHDRIHQRDSATV